MAMLHITMSDARTLNIDQYSLSYLPSRLFFNDFTSYVRKNAENLQILEYTADKFSNVHTSHAFCKSQSLVVHRPRSDNALLFDSQNMYQIRIDKINARDWRLPPSALLERWPQVCASKSRLHNYRRIVSFSQQRTRWILFKLDSTENSRTFGNNVYNKQRNISRNNSIHKSKYKINYYSGLWCLSMLRVYGCVFCSISLLSVYMCVRMPLSLRSIAGVPSSQALPSYPITAHHLCAFLM